MIGKVVEGRYAGASVNKLPDRNVFFIQTADGTKVALSKRNAISIDDVTNQYPFCGSKVMMVMWNDFETSIIQLEITKSKEQSSMMQKEVSTEAQYEGNTRVKRLTCEMCSSNDLVKQEGVFVCQYCGCKYSVEEARKIMTDGTVDVSGSVIQIDSTKQINNHLVNAQRAKNGEDWETAKKYYELVLQNDPYNVEAIFYSIYSDIRFHLEYRRAKELTNRLVSLGANFSAIVECYSTHSADSNAKTLENISEDLYSLGFKLWHAGECKGLNLKFYNTMFVFYETEEKFAEAMEKIIQKDEQPFAYKILIKHYRSLIENRDRGPLINPKIEEFNKRKEAISRRLYAIDPTYRPETSTKAGGCYIATVVYGSYDCPQVWTLRRFRDYTLAESLLGRTFVRAYYATSPTLVKWFGDTKWFKQMWKASLDRLIVQLNKHGVEDTPYEDIPW